MFGSNLRLTDAADSTKASFETTNDSGIVVFKNIKDGLYIVTVSNIGFYQLEKTISVKLGNRTFEFTLKVKSVNFNEVTISAEKPLIRQEEDKMIIDPTPMIGISTNTLEVLESTPGLYVDNDNGIYLSASNPAVIYINGREQKMSTEDIMNLLRNLPPGSIEKIEVMRTPSSKYDAATTGGIINIVLKKGMKIGRFGNLNAGMNQGIRGNRFGGISINNKGEKRSYYINANFNRNDQQEDKNSLRNLRPDTSLNQHSVNTQPGNHYFLGYGLGYDFNEKTSFTYDGRVGYVDKKSETVNNSFTEGINEQHLSESEDHTNNNSTNWNISQDLGLNYKIDTLGSEWDTKFSYTLTTKDGFQNYNTHYSLPIDTTLSGEGKNIQQRHFFLLQSDLIKQLPLKIKLETGFKSTWQNFNSKADFSSIINNTHYPDLSRTNSFNYKESINAAYVQASKTILGGILIKAGIRLEHTYMNGNQTIPTPTNFLVNRVDLFPYVYLSRKVVKMLGYELKSYVIYRRTINRPDYQNLNPYSKYIDPFLYEIGNPNLKPQFTDNIELNISFEDFPVFAVGQNYTKDIFSNVMYRDAIHPEIAVMTYDNLGKSKETYLRGMVGMPPGGKYFFALGAQYNYNDYQGYYEGSPLSYQRGSWRLFTFHSLKLFKETKLTVHAFMIIKGQQGFYELDNFGSLNFGITQSFLNKNLVITLNGKDVLRTMVTGFHLNQGGIQTSGDRYSDNQRIGINIRYNFGIGKKDHKKDFKIPEEEGN